MTTPEQAPAVEPEIEQGTALDLPAGEDVRIGPDESDEPQAGAAEPTD